MPEELDSVMPEAAWFAELRRRLQGWYRRHQRDLPWRKTRDPYAIWLSEIMLQQTQVATVIGYFERFLKRFPTLAHLAEADEAEVLRLWEGLGYYRRARQLHAAARKIMAEHGGQFPDDLASISTLPGIGRYTAGAIASIAFDRRAPIVEANTARLYSRLLGYRHDLTTTAGQKVLWDFATCVLPARQVGTINQALMELGSLVCTPRQPNCKSCPLESLCMTRRLGLQESIPAPKRKVQFESTREAAVVIWRKEQVLLRRRQPGERWAGLWDFVRFPLLSASESQQRREIEQKTRAQVAMNIKLGPRLATIKHGVTRFRITLDCFTAEHCSGNHAQHDGAELIWTTVGGLKDYPLSTTGRQLANLLGSPDLAAISAGRLKKLPARRRRS